MRIEVHHHHYYHLDASSVGLLRNIRAGLMAVSQEVQNILDKARTSSSLVSSVDSAMKALSAQVDDLTAKLAAIPVVTPTTPGLSQEDKDALMEAAGDLDQSIDTLRKDIPTNVNVTSPLPIAQAPQPAPDGTTHDEDSDAASQAVPLAGTGAPAQASAAAPQTAPIPAHPGSPAADPAQAPMQNAVIPSNRPDQVGELPGQALPAGMVDPNAPKPIVGQPTAPIVGSPSIDANQTAQIVAHGGGDAEVKSAASAPGSLGSPGSAGPALGFNADGKPVDAPAPSGLFADTTSPDGPPPGWNDPAPVDASRPQPSDDPMLSKPSDPPAKT